MDERDITDFYFKKKNLYIEAEDITLILKNAIKIVEECDPKNTHFQALEIYPIENGFELHLLLRKADSNLIDDYYYVTYSFDDMAYGTDGEWSGAGRNNLSRRNRRNNSLWYRL